MVLVGQVKSVQPANDMSETCPWLEAYLACLWPEGLL
jgi:hypothetical protein